MQAARSRIVTSATKAARAPPLATFARARASASRQYRHSPKRALLDRSALGRGSCSAAGGKKAAAEEGFVKSQFAAMRADPALGVMNLGAVLSLSGFMMTDMLALRCLAISGSLCGMVYNASRKPPQRQAVAWGAVFLAVRLRLPPTAPTPPFVCTSGCRPRYQHATHTAHGRSTDAPLCSCVFACSR